jgi:N-acyl-D-amino-acid deacylase
MKLLFRYFYIALVVASATAHAASYDVIIESGQVYDGTGAPPFQADVGINGDRIAAIGDLSDAAGNRINAEGLAVAPGFINMLSHAPVSLLVDPRGMSDTLQGVTLEVFGEESMGPWSDEMRQDRLERQVELKFEIPWSTLGGYLDHLEKKGTTPNVASFVGASTIRINVIGYDNRAPTDSELTEMKRLTAEAMEEGAMGLTTALIYAPSNFATTEELIALSKVVSKYNGMYISHLRSEANKWMEAIDETLRIAREADVPVEIYHLKAAFQQNWHKLDQAIEKIEQARRDGVEITANMYTYIAGATGLDGAMPLWVQEGGYDKWAERLQDSEIRARVKVDMQQDADDWENMYFGVGTPDNMLFLGFANPELRKYIGMTLAEVAAERGTDPEDTAMDLVVEDGSRVDTAYFMMSEENVRRQIQLPWVSFGSDAGSLATEDPFLSSNPHPRAYGNFSRLLGKYVREEGIISLEEAVRRLTLLPATNLKIRDRGRLAPGYFADLAIFDPEKIGDRSTFEKPHVYSTGVVHVFVNGEQVLKDGEHTGATPGRIVRGPGWTGRK